MSPWLGSGHGADPRIDPIYAKRNGGGAPIGVRGAGVWFQTEDGDGHPNTAIGFPARQAGDELQVIQFGVGSTSTPLEIGEWTALSPAMGGSLTVWRRLATGDAFDTFTVKASFTGMSSNQMISIYQPVGQVLSVENTSVLESSFGSIWNINAMAATAEPDTFCIQYAMRTRAKALAGLSVTNNNDVIDNQQEQAWNYTTRTIWGFYATRFDAISGTTNAVANSYTPPYDATQLSRYYRFKSS